MKTDEIRQKYLEFFRSKGHEVVPSDSLVPKDDPTLLFTGAGMNQFKEKFLGRNVTYKRATSSQKCLRTADLENVGRTSGHHTFFEMLGNFSFGDYFKKEAIEWAWEFLTKTLKLDPDRLWPSVYKDDLEAYDIWKNAIKVPEKRIIKFGEKENFWPSEAPSKGPNGPCGPCSEIYYDYGKDVGCGKPGCTPACDCGRFVEVWNLVFTQFDRQSDGNLKPLPNKNIDTGMGLERLASVMQGVKTNFEIDIFKPITAEIEKGVGGKIPADKKAKVKAIADHIRAVIFCIVDGVMPSNEERGYVVRKLIRRSLKHAIDIDIKPPFLYKLVSVITDVMKAQYPDLVVRRDEIAQIVKREEEAFLMILETQIPRVEEAFEALKTRGEKKENLTKLAFDFYDTYGMPYDMLEEYAEKFGLVIDKGEFGSLLEKQRSQSRAKSKIKGEIFSETFAKRVEALGLKTEFLGHDESRLEAKVLAVLDEGEVILDRTPFYGESGGQAGDWGYIETETGKMEVEDAKKIGETIVHIGKMLKGRIVKGEKASAVINEDIRRRTMSNHTATHLLQAALRKVLGEHVHQTGSLVDESHLRFDFTHMKKMEPREIERVEELVNDAIKKAILVKKEVKGVEEARKDGAMALFGEKYGDKVRVVTVGDFSKELCGGTHVDNTKDIGIFKITSESSSASGVRRIEALTGKAALEWIEKQKEAESLKQKAESEKDSLRKHMAERLKEETARVDEYIARAKDAGGVKIIHETIGDFSIENMRLLGDKIKEKVAGAVVALSIKEDDKVSFIVAVTDTVASKGVKAGDLAKEMAKLVAGSGGGRGDFAQGGGKDPSGLDKVADKITEIIRGKVQ